MARIKVSHAHLLIDEFLTGLHGMGSISIAARIANQVLKAGIVFYY
jgi:ABC-type transport system involved in cytochrome c biogenesis ATPase subunit